MIATLLLAATVQVAAPSATTQRIPLWNGLASGMRPADVVVALTQMGVRAKVAKSGDHVETRNPVIIDGVSYTLDLGFVNGRLFHVDVIRELDVVRQRADPFPTVRDELAHAFGPWRSTTETPLIVVDNSASLVTEQTATFAQDDLQLDLIVKRWFSRYRTSVSDKVVVRYWRSADAARFAAAQARKPARQVIRQ